MIPVDMTREHDPPRSLGDCWEACLASILELPIDAVRLRPDQSQLVETHRVLARLGLSIVQLQCCAQNGWLLDLLDEASAWAIAGGTSPRAWHVDHAVVWRSGEIAHDPHTSRAGLAGEPKDLTFFLALDPARVRP